MRGGRGLLRLAVRDFALTLLEALRESAESECRNDLTRLVDRMWDEAVTTPLVDAQSLRDAFLDLRLLTTSTD